MAGCCLERLLHEDDPLLDTRVDIGSYEIARVGRNHEAEPQHQNVVYLENLCSVSCLSSYLRLREGFVGGRASLYAC
jgi:hypothetical protein